MGGLQAKSMMSQRNRATHKMADMRYYGNVMTTTRWRLCYYGNVMATTRWRLCVTMETLSQHSDNVSSVTHAGCLHADQTIQKVDKQVQSTTVMLKM